MITLGFFDNGEMGEFKYFSLAHFIPIILMSLIIYIIIRFRKQISDWKHEPSLRLGIGILMITIDMSYYWLQASPLGDVDLSNLANNLPIRVCGWASILGGFLVISKNKTIFEIFYFWVLAGATNALLTPGVIMNNGPMRFRYYQFWIEHTMLFITLAYMISVQKMRPTKKSAIKSFIALFVLGLFAIWANFSIEGANYLYLAKAVDGDSILNFLPINLGYRLLIMSAIVIVLFSLLYLPWWIKDNREKTEGKLIINAE